MIIIQTTVGDDKNAKELINLLLETNKIACGTFHTIQSSYKWKDEIINEPWSEIEKADKLIIHSMSETIWNDFIFFEGGCFSLLTRYYNFISQFQFDYRFISLALAIDFHNYMKFFKAKCNSSKLYFYVFIALLAN